MKNDPLMTFENWAREKDPAELGRLLKEYVTESNHNSWDCHDRRDMTGYRHLFEDMMRYYDGCEPGSFQRTSNVEDMSDEAKAAWRKISAHLEAGGSMFDKEED